MSSPLTAGELMALGAMAQRTNAELAAKCFKIGNELGRELATTREETA